MVESIRQTRGVGRNGSCNGFCAGEICLAVHAALVTSWWVDCVSSLKCAIFAFLRLQHS
jgi:hypothetical protein